MSRLVCLYAFSSLNRPCLLFVHIYWPDAFICFTKKSLWACKSLQGGFVRPFRYANICWGCTCCSWGSLPWKMCKRCTDTPVMVFQRQKQKFNWITHLAHCMFVQLWLTVWTHELCLTCCWMGCITAHPVAILLISFGEGCTQKSNALAPTPLIPFSSILAEHHMLVAALSTVELNPICSAL